MTTQLEAAERRRIRNRMHDDLDNQARSIKDELKHYGEYFSPSERKRLSDTALELSRLALELSE